MNIYNYTAPNVGEIFTTLLEDKNIKISQIVSSNKVEKKIYNQDENEFVVLLKGAATLEIEGKIVSLQEGDTVQIPAHTKHQILSTEQGTLWLAIYYK
jgi:cupin 2 domain-containing protein